jgi:hypothetical protein
MPMLPGVNVCGEETRQPTADIRNWPGNEKGNTRNLSTKARMKSFYRMSGGTTNVSDGSVIQIKIAEKVRKAEEKAKRAQEELNNIHS